MSTDTASEGRASTTSSMPDDRRGRRERLLESLRAELDPEHLDVFDESSGHNVPEGSVSHFRVLLASARFAGMPRIARHREVHRAAAEELSGGMHALAIDAWTPQEWRQRGAPSRSPHCRGGGR